MRLELTVCVALAALFALIEQCDTRPNRKTKSFLPPPFPGLPCLDICNKTEKYPAKAIQRLMRQNKKRWLELSGSVIAPKGRTITPTLKYSYPGAGEENLCRTQSRVMRPRIGLDENMKPRYIVNVKGFEQIITYEYCLHQDRECYGNGNLPNDFKTVCKQSFSTIRLVALNSTGHFEYGRFNIPSTCVCSYQRQLPLDNA